MISSKVDISQQGNGTYILAETWETPSQPGPVVAAPSSRDDAMSVSQTAPSELAVRDACFPGPSDLEIAQETRRRQGWGNRYEPKVEDAEGRTLFYRICDDLEAELRAIDDVMADGEVTEEGAGVIAEVEHHLERLYDCPFGEGESLKGVVVAIQSQLSNARWTVQHVNFLKAALLFLRARWVINDQTVDTIDDMIEEHGLDVFRGTVSEPDVVTRYIIAEARES